MSHHSRPRWRLSWEFWLYLIPSVFLAVVWGCSAEDLGEGGRQSRSGRSDGRSRATSRNNLKQIGLALHNYHDTFRTFPPGGVYDRQGKGHHSWQTFLLPFVEQAETFRRVDFNRPWNDDRNAPVFRTRIEVYEIPAQSAVSAIVKRNITGGFAPSHYAGNQRVLFRNSRKRLRDILVGTSNTLFAGEVSAGFKAWGDPSNYRDPAIGLGNKPDRFGGSHGDRTQFLLIDGSVREIPNDIDPETLRRLADPADGQPVPEF